MKHMLVILSKDWKYEGHELLELGDLWFALFNLKLNEPFQLGDKIGVVLYPTILCSSNTGESRVVCVKSMSGKQMVYVVHDLYFTGMTYLHPFLAFRHRFKQFATAVREVRDSTVANHSLLISAFTLSVEERVLFRAQYAEWKASPKGQHFYDNET